MKETIMSLSYTSKTWSDTSTSGTAITQQDLQKYESTLKALVDKANDIQSWIDKHDDTGWTVLYKNNGQFVKCRRIGKACWLQWYFKACAQTQWTCPAKLPKGMWPQANFTAAGADHYGTSNNTVTAYVWYDGTIYFNDYLPSDRYSEGIVSWLVDS